MIASYLGVPPGTTLSRERVDMKKRSRVAAAAAALAIGVSALVGIGASPASAASPRPSPLASGAEICESRPGFCVDTSARVSAHSSPKRGQAQGLPFSGGALRTDRRYWGLLLQTERVASLNKTSGVSGTVNLGHPAAFVR